MEIVEAPMFYAQRNVTLFATPFRPFVTDSAPQLFFKLLVEMSVRIKGYIAGTVDAGDLLMLLLGAPSRR